MERRAGRPQADGARQKRPGGYRAVLTRETGVVVVGK